MSCLNHPSYGKSLLGLVRQRLEAIEVSNPNLARLLCQVIPAQCPFERKISLFGRTVLNIPPLCQLNPIYNQLMLLRFRSLSFLANECGEDVTPYC